MTCTSSTAPINISSKDYTDDCSLKCLFKYDYPRTPATTIRNEGNHLAVSYDKVKVDFNNNELRVEGIRIYTPSLHTFNGARADGEIVITHMDMGISLLVCIPIVISSAKTEASKNLEYLIAQAASRTPNVGEKALISIKNFTLNSFIPKKSPLYSYQATLPYAPCNGNHQYIVFMPDKTPVFISSQTMGVLKKILIAHDSTIKPSTEYFFNKRGAVFTDPNSDDGDDDIYIECHPTGADGELIAVPPSSSKTPDKPPMDFNNPVVIIVLGIIGGILLILCLTVIGQFFYKRRTAGAGSSANPGTAGGD
jgi:carbonic anhydrase